jgi:KDO2-lipid IV(A) lauroyltransferase
LDTLLYYLFYIFYVLIKYTPDFLKKYILNIFYFLAYHLDFFRKKVVLKNLEIAFPNLSEKERKKIAKQFYKNFIFYMADMVESLEISKEELANKVKIIGEENINKALKSGKPIVFMTAHFGNWEVAPKVIGAFYTKTLSLSYSALTLREFPSLSLSSPLFNASIKSLTVVPSATSIEYSVSFTVILNV